MTLKTKLIVPVLATILLFGLGMAVLTYVMLGRMTSSTATLFESMSRQEVDDNLDKAFDTFTSTLERFSHTDRDEAAVIGSMPAVIEAYRLAHRGDIDDPYDATVQQAREQLRQIIAPLQKQRARFSSGEVMKVHFHLPNARSLVRTWREGWNTQIDGKKVDASDDLRSFRQTVLVVNRGDGQAVSGIEIGRGGFAIRGLVPIEDPENGRHLGSIEILSPFSDVTDELATQSDSGLAVYMLAEHLDVANRMQDAEAYPIIGGRYVQCAINDTERLAPMIDRTLLDQATEKLVVRHGQGITVGAWPIRDFNQRTVGVMVVGMDTNRQATALAHAKTENHAQSRQLLMGIMISLVLACIAIVIVFITVLRVVVLRRITDLVNRLHDISQGEGNLTRRLDEDSQDELGTLSRSFNVFVDKIAQLVSATKGISQELAGACRDIHAATTDINEQITSQDVQINSAAAAVEELAASSDEMRQRGEAASQATSVAKSKAADGNQTVLQSINWMKQISESVRKSTESMKNLGTRLDAINNLIDTINDIADQTNLLALNAAIEAARAGDQGRGFAVVADEVRKLADRTTHATAEVSSAVQAIHQESQHTMSAMESGMGDVERGLHAVEESGRSLAEIETSSEAMTGVMTQVACAVEQQSTASSQIATAMETILDLSRSSSQAVERSSQTIKQLKQKSEQLEQMLQRFNLNAPDRRQHEESVPIEIQERRLDVQASAKSLLKSL